MDVKLSPAYTGCHWVNGGWSHTWSDGTNLPVLRGRDTDGKGTGNGAGKGKEEDGDGDDDDDDDDEDDDEDEPDTSKIKDPVAKAIADTEARLRHKHRDQTKKKVEEALAEVKRQTELAGKGEAEKEKARADQFEKEAGELRVNNRALLDENAFYRHGGASRFDDPEIALLAARRLPEYKDLEVDDDDPTVLTGMDRVLEALAKAKPGLLAKPKDDDDDEEKPASGRPMNGKKKTKKADNEAELRRKYPALR